MSKKQIFALLLGGILTISVVLELFAFLPATFQGIPFEPDAFLKKAELPVAEIQNFPDKASAGYLALAVGLPDGTADRDALAPERRAEYFFAVRLLLVLAAAIMTALAFVVGIYSRYSYSVALGRARYEKIVFFGFLLPVVLGGVIIYFNLFGATDYGIWYNWPKFTVCIMLLTCAVLYITLAMTRKYVNRFCHSQNIHVPPFQRWPGLLNVGTLLILLAASLTPPEWRTVHYCAMGWVVLTAVIYILRELRYLKALNKYSDYYRYGAGTAYVTLCISSLGLALIAVPLWWCAENREISRDETVMVRVADLPEYSDYIR